MSFEIKNHRLEGVTYIPSPNVGGTLKPVGIVNHYTAGYDDAGAIATFQNKASKVSAHLIIDRDGTVTQMVPFNRVAWHAGPSKYAGWNGLNSHFIGIEFDNIGYLRKTASGGYIDPYGRQFEKLEPNQIIIAEAEPRIGSGIFYWPGYTDIQIENGLAITEALIKKYGIEAIVTHEEIDTRGWKTDPGPAFPQARFKALLRDEKTEETVKGGSAKATVIASILNVRSGAGVQWEKFAEVKKGEIVTITAQVGDWSYITFGENRNGWVASQYLSRI